MNHRLWWIPFIILAPLCGVLTVESPAVGVTLAVIALILAFQSVIVLAQVVLAATLCMGVYTLNIPGTDTNALFLVATLLAPVAWLRFPQAFASREVKRLIFFVIVSTGLFSASLAFNGYPATLSAIWEFIAYASILLLVATLAAARRSVLVIPIAGAALFHSAVGTMEFVSGTSIFYTSWKGGEASHIGPFLRAASTVGDPNYLALALLALGFSSLHLSDGSSVAGRFARIAGIVALTTLPLTFSRAGMIGLVVAVVALALARGKQRKGMPIALTTAAVTFVAVVPNPLSATLIERLSGASIGDASVSQRLAVQELGVELALRNPVLGVGPGAFPEFARVLHDPSRPFDVQTAVLNTYLYTWLAGGMLAFLMLTWLIAIALRRTFRASSALFGGVAGTLIVIATLDAYTLTPFWALMGLALALPKFSVTQRPSVLERSRD